MIVLITFVIFSQSFAEDTWNALLATLPIAIYISPKDGFFSLRDRKRSNKYSPLRKKTSKLSAAPVGCSFEKFWRKIHTKSPIISFNDQETWSKFLHSKKKRPEIVPLNSFNVVLTILRVSFSRVVQTFLLEVQKWFKKTKFTNFILQFFMY